MPPPHCCAHHHPRGVCGLDRRILRSKTKCLGPSTIGGYNLAPVPAHGRRALEGRRRHKSANATQIEEALLCCRSGPAVDERVPANMAVSASSAACLSSTSSLHSVHTSSKVEDLVNLVTSLRTKHYPRVHIDARHNSTVGLVVEGACQVSAVVPGGPCDRDFGGERIEVGDRILRVDGRELSGDELLSGLVGADLVGSSVSMLIQKHDPSARTFDATVERGALARIFQMGNLFLMLSELIALVGADRKHITCGDLLRVEAQAKVVEQVHIEFLTCFKSHVHDLEEALFDLKEAWMKVSSASPEYARVLAGLIHGCVGLQETEKQTAGMRVELGRKVDEAASVKVRADRAEAQLRSCREREARCRNDDQDLRKQLEMMQADLEGERQAKRELEAQLRELKNRVGRENLELVRLKAQLESTQEERDKMQSLVRDGASRAADESRRLAQELDLLREKLASSVRDGEEKAEAFAAVGSERDSIRVAATKLQARLEEVTIGAERHAKTLEHELEVLRVQLASRVSEHKEAMATASHELEQESSKLAVLRRDCECGSLKLQLEQVAQENSATREENGRLEVMLSELRLRCDRCECSKLRAELTDVQSRCIELEKKLKPRLQLA